MIALQEELDWEVYGLYGLLDTRQSTADAETVPDSGWVSGRSRSCWPARWRPVRVETQWFTRHGSTPITEIPAHWPEEYRAGRGAADRGHRRRPDIGADRAAGVQAALATEPWEKKELAALRDWLLDRCEDRVLWFAPADTGPDQPRPMTVNRLAERLRADDDFVSVARLYAGQDVTWPT